MFKKAGTEKNKTDIVSGLEKKLREGNSKPDLLGIANQIGVDADHFNALIMLFLGNDYRLSQKASWVIIHCMDQHPELIDPHLRKLILNLKNPVKVAVKRNTVRLLQFVSIPRPLLGSAAGICFEYLSNSREPIAVRVFSMTVLFHISQKEPGIKNELQMILEDLLPNTSAAINSRGKKLLQQLRKEGTTMRTDLRIH